MSSILCKSFNLCFSKFMCFPIITLSPPPPSTATIDDQDQNFAPATNPTLFKNFNSLYDATYSDCSTSKSLTFSSTATTAAAEEDSLSSSASDFSDDDSVPDFTSAFASHRFFFSSPGISNSIFEPPEPPPLDPYPAAVVNGGVAVQAYSPDPYSDFRKSMMEMIEAREITDVKSINWEYLKELLLCYLTLNPKHTHKFIVGAFSDVVVSLVSPPLPGDDVCREIRQCARSD
ncbi:hypothetical protein ACS0TY_027529 [Phlomoides rotata]